MRSFYKNMLLCFSLILFFCNVAEAEPYRFIIEDKNRFHKEQRMLYEFVSHLSGIPWNVLAAIDQVERSIQNDPRMISKRNKLIAIDIPPERWSGPLNPIRSDMNPVSISIFNGIGVDGNGDGLANREDPIDVLYTFATLIGQYGITEQDLRHGLTEYYKREKRVEMIIHLSQMYKELNQFDLNKYIFPLPQNLENYGFQNTWGYSRGWGGRRIHEGIDLYAPYGTPILSSSYGYLEVMGWNKYGGWRIGIRDGNNIYHYYAHLSRFPKGLSIGKIIAPGETIGWMGSSGYGKPGTSGKFPPHLHYGMYRETDKGEVPFNPYPYLKRWEKENLKNKKD